MRIRLEYVVINCDILVSEGGEGSKTGVRIVIYHDFLVTEWGEETENRVRSQIP